MVLGKRGKVNLPFLLPIFPNIKSKKSKIDATGCPITWTQH